MNRTLGAIYEYQSSPEIGFETKKCSQIEFFRKRNNYNFPKLQAHSALSLVLDIVAGNKVLMNESFIHLKPHVMVSEGSGLVRRARNGLGTVHKPVTSPLARQSTASGRVVLP